MIHSDLDILQPNLHKQIRLTDYPFSYTSNDTYKTFFLLSLTKNILSRFLPFNILFHFWNKLIKQMAQGNVP